MTVTVDVALFTLRAGALHVAVHPRPAPGTPRGFGLIGGAVDTARDADAAATAARHLREQAGLDGVYTEQLQTFASATRQAGAWAASIAHLALLPPGRWDDGADLKLLPAGDADALAADLVLDHAAIVAAALGRLRGKGAYSTLPAHLLDEPFTLPELRAAYEAVMGEPIDQSSFRRKIADLGAVEPERGETRRSAVARRPAQLYRLANRVALFDRRL